MHHPVQAAYEDITAVVQACALTPSGQFQYQDVLAMMLPTIDELYTLSTTSAGVSYTSFYLRPILQRVTPETDLCTQATQSR
jgi:hypothetical protein